MFTEATRVVAWAQIQVHRRFFFVVFFVVVVVVVVCVQWGNPHSLFVCHVKKKVK